MCTEAGQRRCPYSLWRLREEGEKGEKTKLELFPVAVASVFQSGGGRGDVAESSGEGACSERGGDAEDSPCYLRGRG